MKPKFYYTEAEKASIPEALAAFYVAKDGGYVLDVDGAADARRLAEFRNNNDALKAQVENLAAAATGKQPVEFRNVKPEAILAEITAARDADRASGSAKGREAVEEASRQQIEALKTAHKNELATRDTKIQEHQKELSRLKIDHKILEVGTAAGLLPTAGEDLAFRASKVFSLDPDTGKILAKNPDGTGMFDTQGEPMTPEKWVEAQRKNPNAVHLFKPAEGSETPGGGAGGGNGGGATFKGPNPWDPKSLNRTQQSLLFKQDPANARRMANMHGVTLPAAPAK